MKTIDALIRWLDAKKGRRMHLGYDLGITRSAVSQMLERDYVGTRHVERLYEITGIPIKYLIRRAGSGLTEQELSELDAIARKRELEEQQKIIEAEKQKMRNMRRAKSA